MQIQTQPMIASGSSHNVLFMPGLYDEAMQLLFEAQEYFTRFGEADQDMLELHLRPLYVCEMSRITLRLSCVISWLMAQRSVVNGEMDSATSLHYGMEFQESCLVDSSVLRGVLPVYVCNLLALSLQLYERVLRLDSSLQPPMH